MWQKIIFLLIVFKVALISSQSTISCSYSQLSPQLPYTCHLTINNPIGLDNFVTIPGQHLPGRGNVDVTSLSASFQNTVNIPSVICRQFPNIQDLYMTSNNIQVIGESSFAGCGNLLQVSLVMNNIMGVPGNTFRNNPQLAVLNLARNSIQSIETNSFTGSSIGNLDLSYNRLNSLAPGLFTSLAETLTNLQIISNELTTLPSGAFAGLTRLESLRLSANSFGTLPNDAFAGLDNLILLHLVNNGLSEPTPELFSGLSSLTEIHLESNGISVLPDNLFATSRRLTNVFLAANNLTEVTAAPFGNNLPALEVLNLINNQIRSIDPEFFEIAENLHTLHLGGTECSNDNLEFTFDDRSNIRERLEMCFRGFGPELISCNYEMLDSTYGCHMTVRNPIGNEFSTIDGEHLGGQNNANVQLVDIISGNTRNIPQIICQQFPQITAMLIINSNVQIINTQSFSNCGNLERLHLGDNSIMIVPDNTFSGNPRLTELHLGTNRIITVAPNAFAGTVLSILDLSNNFLQRVDGSWLRPVASTLRSLDLIGSSISQIDSNAFEGLTGLTGLFLSDNRWAEFHGDLFVPLTSLQDLSLASCNIRELNAQWFRTLANLTRLYIARNELTEFPANIFNSLPNLQEIFFYENMIVELRAESFGAALPSIHLLYGSRNQINSFDDAILDGANELDSILFADNLCANFNLIGVRGDLEIARQNLQGCTANFQLQTDVSCLYDRMITGRIYWCQMTAINPTGVSVDNIAGDHLQGGTDDSVMYVQVDSQNTRVIPAALCRQFESMELLDLLNSNIFEITSDVFRGCTFLRELFIMGNSIRSLPAQAFSGAMNLFVLVLANNQIEQISPFAFEGTQLHELDLSHNRITEFSPLTFSIVGRTLRILRLTDNSIQSIPQFAFDGLPNLQDLELNGNQITRIPHNAFFRSINLRVLQIANNQLQRLEAEMFSRCDNLVDLELALNQIDFLPEDIFNIPNLQTLGLVQNNLRGLDAAAFGRSLRSLLVVDASLNHITSFDPEILRADSSIVDMDLSFNTCIDANFANIPQFRDDVLRALDGCIVNFNDVVISCEYADAGEAVYMCDLTIDNPIDRLRFVNISGEHLEGRNDNFVRTVSAVDQNSRAIPKIICDTFQSVESIIFAASNLEVVQFESFINCPLLYSLNLASNNIIDIPDGVFRNSPYLNILILSNNMIENLTPGVFFGTQVGFLDLELNNFRHFNPEWFLDIQQSLMWLYLQHNQISRFPRNAFASLSNLLVLELTGNENTFIPSSSFNRLTRLYTLHLASCGIRNLNHRWFDDLRFLTHLELDSNEIEELPTEIFDLNALEYLGLAFNRLTVLDSRSFGAHLSELFRIDAEFNAINAIDRQLVVNATSLESLSLIGNECVNLNFMDVQNNMEVVLRELEGCFGNFVGN